MVNFKVLVLTYIFSIFIITVAYAVWKDTNEIGSTVRTGELDLKFVNNNTNLVKNSDYVECNFTIDESKGNEAKITISNMYPGSWAMIKLEIVNSGTIPAKLIETEMDFKGDLELLKYLDYKAGVSIDKDNNDKVIDWKKYFEGNLLDFSDDINSYLGKLENSYLESNGKGRLYLGVPVDNTDNLYGLSMEENYLLIKFNENASAEMQNKTISFVLKLNFKQYSL